MECTYYDKVKNLLSNVDPEKTILKGTYSLKFLTKVIKKTYRHFSFLYSKRMLPNLLHLHIAIHTLKGVVLNE